MRVSTFSAILGLVVGFASAAPVQISEVQDREAAPQWYDTTYVDKAKREEVEGKRGAKAQWYDTTYIDKAKREEVDSKREAEAQWYDITYIDKRDEEEKKRKATYIG